MPLITREDELHGYAPDAFAFWRNLAVYFCVFSVLGHWMEIAYCSFMNLFGIVDADSLVVGRPDVPLPRVRRGHGGVRRGACAAA